MKKPKINIIIDSVMFVCLMAIAGMGFLMKFVLIPGQQRWVKFGENVNLSFLGLERHEWGTIHLVMSLILLVFLVLHLVLHWNFIECICKKIIPNLKIRILIVSSFIVLCLLFLASPFLINPEINEGGRGNNHQTANHTSVLKNDFSSTTKEKVNSGQNKEKARKFKNRKNINKSNNYKYQQNSKIYKRNKNRKHYR